MQRDYVTFRQQPLQRDVIHPEFLRRLLVRERVIREDPHAETLKQPRELETDLPGPDDPDGLSVQVEPDQAAEGEIILPDPVEGTVNVAVQRQQKPQRVFGHGKGGVGRDAHDGEVQLIGRLHRHVTETGTAHRHQPDFQTG